MIYNTMGVVIGMTHIMLPIMVLALYSVMRGIDVNLVKVSDSLFNREPLQLPVIVFGAAHGARWHEANEYITVDGLREFMKFTATWLFAWADEPRP